MDSAAKAPFLARFRVRRCGVREMEEMGLRDQNTSAIMSSYKDDPNVSWQACIFKVGDDVRQVSEMVDFIFFYLKKLCIIPVRGQLQVQVAQWRRFKYKYTDSCSLFNMN